MVGTTQLLMKKLLLSLKTRFELAHERSSYFDFFIYVLSLIWDKVEITHEETILTSYESNYIDCSCLILKSKLLYKIFSTYKTLYTCTDLIKGICDEISSVDVTTFVKDDNTCEITIVIPIYTDFSWYSNDNLSLEYHFMLLKKRSFN